MGPRALIQRRELLALGALGAASLAACDAPAPRDWSGGWVGASHARGHRLHAPLPAAGEGPLRRHAVLVIGGGIAGLACARALAARGVDFALLELEDETGGNSRGHVMAGHACPLGAHYLPVPDESAAEVQQLLQELGLARHQGGRLVVDERHLCHAPQERLFIDGQWHDSLLPPPRDAAALAQYRQFAVLVAQAQRALGFAMPSTRAPWRAGHAELDAQTFAAWLARQGITDERLRWYLDYCCRDDYGADAATVSAWAGLHYFASRHGFHPPGDDSAERDPVLTWPEGNAGLSRAIARPLAGQIHAGRTVLRISPGRHEVQVLAWNEQADAPERWVAQQVVMATPLFVARRLVDTPPPALTAAAATARYAPWLVANLLIDAPLLERPGTPPAWDNVAYGSRALGYVDAGHQRLSPVPGATVLTAYWALPESDRPALLAQDWRTWGRRVVDDITTTLHADLPARLQRVDLMRWGHAMSIPVPGVRGSAALAALRQTQGRLQFAHADLAGYSVFEEAYTWGVQAARRVAGTRA